MTNFYGQYIGFGSQRAIPPTPPDANPVLTGGELWTCGRATAGGLGVGNTTYYSSPVQVGGQTDWKSGWMSFSNASVFIKTTGKMYSWGEGNLGVNGRGNTTDVSSPIQVGALTTWNYMGGGEKFWTAIKTDGTLWSCGYNTQGQLGLGDTTHRSSPVQVGSATNWHRVSCGSGRNSAAITTNGELWTWGAGNYGSLGHDPNVSSSSSPIQVGSDTNWNWCATNMNSMLAVKQDGTLWFWGRGADGDSPLGNSTNFSTPQQVGALTNWRYPALCSDTTVLSQGGAVKTDGTLWCWGDNTDGEVLDGTTTTRNSPVQIGSLTDWRAIQGGKNNFMLEKTDGTIWTGGTNAGGMQMHGDLLKRSSPSKIGSLTTWNTNAFAHGCHGNSRSWGIK